jgi:hypothetical protein
MIFDHLEDSVFAPDSSCLRCADTACDGTNCSSTFDPNDFHEATTFFMQQLQPMVANAKLDRPLDSHPPLSRELMLTRLEADDWGDSTDGAQYEQEEHVYAEHYVDSYDHDYQNIRNIMNMTRNSIIKAQALMNMDIVKGRTNKNISR